MTPTASPTLTIVTVCFNAAATLDTCIRSVAESKSTHIEYIVIDGGSTDGTQEILARYCHVIDLVVSEPDEGIFDAMNKALLLAKGEYVAFLNADDAYIPGAIAAVLAVLHTQEAAVDVLYGDWVGVAPSGARHMRRAEHRATVRYALCHQAVFARRAIFPAPRGFDMRYRLCADFDLLTRWRNEGRRFHHMAEPVVFFSEAGASAKFLQRSAVESISIAVRRARSLTSLMFAARMGAYLMRSVLDSGLKRQEQNASDHAPTTLNTAIERESSSPVDTPPVGAQHFRLVVSAVNLVEGGGLTVLRQCLTSASTTLPAAWEIVALVHNTSLVDVPRVRAVAVSSAKKSWGRRLYWEWWGFRKMFQKRPATLWLSLHDVTPRVNALRQAVYCHNPSPFYSVGWRDARLEPTFFLFCLLYSFLYRIFIHRNYAVVVQQAWIREAFFRRMGKLPLIVAYPAHSAQSSTAMQRRDKVSPFIFLYPALPRLFKNFETLCSAAKLLGSRTSAPFEIRLTVDGTENRTARWLVRNFTSAPGVRFIGRQSTSDMARQYREASAVVFPSRLETWGLPISEAKACGLPLLLADLPYSREAVGEYPNVSFFPVDNAAALADHMLQMLNGAWHPDGHHERLPQEPFAPDWPSLWALLTTGLSQLDTASPAHCSVKQDFATQHDL